MNLNLSRTTRNDTFLLSVCTRDTARLSVTLREIPSNFSPRTGVSNSNETSKSYLARFLRRTHWNETKCNVPGRWNSFRNLLGRYALRSLARSRFTKLPRSSCRGSYYLWKEWFEHNSQKYLKVSIPITYKRNDLNTIHRGTYVSSYRSTYYLQKK